VVEQVCRLKYLRNRAERIVPGIYFTSRGLIAEFVKESIPQLCGDTIES
jgi:hypothetical protein